MNNLATLPRVVVTVNPKFLKEGTTMFTNQVPPEIMESALFLADILEIPHDRIKKLTNCQILSFIEEKGEYLK